MLVIRDTRESGEMLEAAVAAGIAAAAARRCSAASCRRPARRCSSRRYGFDLAVVLSASHNPYRDNGIKFFGGDGFKLSDATELEIEALLERAPPAPARAAACAASTARSTDYLRALHARFGELDLTGRGIAAGLRQRRHLPRRRRRSSAASAPTST